MLIKVGDNVSVNVRKILPREGKITDISIATHAEDPAGESGTQVQEYDTDMGFIRAEVGTSEYDTIDVTSDNGHKVTADVDGEWARISIGKSF